MTPARIADYVQRVETAGCGIVVREQLTDIEAAQERLLMGMRTIEGAAWTELAPLRIDEALVARLTDGGLLQLAGGRLIATRRGRAVLDRLALELAQGAGSG